MTLLFSSIRGQKVEDRYPVVTFQNKRHETRDDETGDKNAAIQYRRFTDIFDLNPPFLILKH